MATSSLSKRLEVLERGASSGLDLIVIRKIVEAHAPEGTTFRGKIGDDHYESLAGESESGFRKRLSDLAQRRATGQGPARVIYSSLDIPL